MNEELRFLELISSRLDAVGIPYMLTGSMAMMFYSVPRMTRDIDLVLECRQDDVQKLIDCFSVDCYVDEAAVRDAVATLAMFNIIHLEWTMKADFVVRKDSEFRALEFARRRVQQLEGFSVWVVTPEDLILSKLDWARESRSELQLRDVSTMLAAVPQLDFGYLEKWAGELGVLRDLDELRPK